MTSGGLLRKTFVGCLVLATAAGLAGIASGYPRVGASLAVGMILGSLNGYLIQGLLTRGAPFVAASLLRIVFFSSIVLLAALALGDSVWALALGLALAQLVMVAFSVRAGLRS
ncbi:MAG TPA: hypothetical protein VGA47_03560 [Candidatus Dormibacteraeota bacterium]